MIHVLRGSLGCVVGWWKVEAAAIVKLAIVTPPGQKPHQSEAAFQISILPHYIVGSEKNFVVHTRETDCQKHPHGVQCPRQSSWWSRC